MANAIYDQLNNKFYNLKDNISDLQDATKITDVYYEDKKILLDRSTEISGKRSSIITLQTSADEYFEMEGIELLELAYMLQLLNDIYINEYQKYNDFIINNIPNNLDTFYKLLESTSNYIVNYIRGLNNGKRHNFDKFYDFQYMMDDVLSFKTLYEHMGSLDIYNQLVIYRSKLVLGTYNFITDEYIKTVNNIFHDIEKSKLQLLNKYNYTIITDYNILISNLLEKLKNLDTRIIFINNYRSKFLIDEDSYVASSEFNSEIELVVEESEGITPDNTNKYENDVFTSTSDEINNIYKEFTDLISYIYTNMNMVINENEIISASLITQFNDSISYYIKDILKLLTNLNKDFTYAHINYTEYSNRISIIKSFYKNDEVGV